MSIRIEIQEQPERSRFWAEIEVGGMVARRKDVTSPQSEGLAGMLALVQATYYELVPPPAAVAEAEPGVVGVMVPGDNAGDPDQMSVVATLPYTAADVADWYEDSPALTSSVAVTGTPEEIAAAVAEVDAWNEAEAHRQDLAVVKMLEHSTQDKPAPKRRGRPPKKAPEGE